MALLEASVIWVTKVCLKLFSMNVMLESACTFSKIFVSGANSMTEDLAVISFSKIWSLLNVCPPRRALVSSCYKTQIIIDVTNQHKCSTSTIDKHCIGVNMVTRQRQ